VRQGTLEQIRRDLDAERVEQFLRVVPPVHSCGR
jgi:hypothetical protein